MVYAKILGTGSYLPQQRLTNEELSQRIDTSDQWITERTGIKARHIAHSTEQTSDLAVHAARSALEYANLSTQDIDLIIVATTTPDMIFPSTACIVQNKLGIHGCPAFDVQAVCAGFIYAIVTAQAYIQTGLAKTALVIGAETLSHIVDWTDRRTCVLFGDGAGAVILGASNTPGIIHARLQADGAYHDILNASGKIAHGEINGSPYLKMDGQAVYKFATRALAQIGEEVLQATGFTADQINWVIPHQANQRIIESTARQLNIDSSKIILTLAEHGNTSAASIPLALDTAIRDGRIQKEQTLLLEGIGGGFTWGAVLIRY